MVVLQLSPDQTMPGARRTRQIACLSIGHITESVAIDKDTIYAIPLGKMLSLIDDHARLKDPEPPGYPPTSIDFLMSFGHSECCTTFSTR